MNVSHPIEKRIPYLEGRLCENDDLVLNYSKGQSTIKVWSPNAKEAWLNLYETAETSSVYKKIQLTQKDNVWTTIVDEDLDGFFYTYSFIHHEEEVETADVYSKAVGLNGNRSAILSLD